MTAYHLQLFGVLAIASFLAGCAVPSTSRAPAARHEEAESQPRIKQGADRSDSGADVPKLSGDSTAEDYVEYALRNNPGVEAAYQRWVAKSWRGEQLGALPDARLTLGYFLEEVETRVGPQEGKIGVRQAFPWFGTLQGREDAADRAALAERRRFEAAQLEVRQQVVSALHDLVYLDKSIEIAGENLQILQSFVDVIKARYRVAEGSHPELIRVQVALGQLEDRLEQLRLLRPAFVAEINAALNRDRSTSVTRAPDMGNTVADVELDGLVNLARESNPMLLALDEEVRAQAHLEAVAEKEGYPQMSLGVDYIATGEAQNRSLSGSGDDPILVSFGISLPLSRGKYKAARREATARRLAVSHQRSEEENRIESMLSRVWFDHADADRRVRLYEQTLIPKAEESLRASLAGFRTGEATFLDVLDTERTLLEFALSAERARADRGKALVRIDTLVGRVVPTRESGGESGNVDKEGRDE